MKLDTFENSDGGRAKSREIETATVEENSWRETRLKPNMLPKTAKSGSGYGARSVQGGELRLRWGWSGYL